MLLQAAVEDGGWWSRALSAAAVPCCRLGDSKSWRAAGRVLAAAGAVRDVNRLLLPLRRRWSFPFNTHSNLFGGQSNLKLS